MCVFTILLMVCALRVGVNADFIMKLCMCAPYLPAELRTARGEETRIPGSQLMTPFYDRIIC